MSETFDVQNVKCDGCAAIIRDNLGDRPEVSAVDVDVASGRVTVDGDGLSRDDLARAMAELGYPEA